MNRRSTIERNSSELESKFSDPDFIFWISFTAFSLTRAIQDEENAFEATAHAFENSTFMHIFDDNGKPVEINLNDDDIETLPETKKNLEKRVHFYLYTRQIDSRKPQVLLLNDVATLKASDFNPRRPTKIVTHGWMNSLKSRACTSIRDGTLTKTAWKFLSELGNSIRVFNSTISKWKFLPKSA